MLDVFEAVNRDIRLMARVVVRSLRDHFRRQLERVERLAAGSQSRIGWPSRASTSSLATAPRQRTDASHQANARTWNPGRRRNGRDAGVELQPVAGFYWLVSGRTIAGTRRCSQMRTAGPAGSAGAVHARQQLVLRRERKEGSLAVGQLADWRFSPTTTSGSGRGDQGHPVRRSRLSTGRWSMRRPSLPRCSRPPLPVLPEWSRSPRMAAMEHRSMFATPAIGRPVLSEAGCVGAEGAAMGASHFRGVLGNGL
jgi:hypothetical protein